MERASVPGAIVGIWRDGSEPYVRAFGVRDTATGEKMPSRTPVDFVWRAP
jgi:D-alanyl-D-alanine carboxypeptidase